MIILLLKKGSTKSALGPCIELSQMAIVEWRVKG